MKGLHLIKAHHALPFIEVLKKRGAPLRLIAKQAGLPLEAAMRGEGVIGERALWRFIDYAANREGDPFFGYHCAVADPVLKDGRLGAMPLSLDTSLEKILKQFFFDAQKESSGCNYELVPEGEDIWLRRTPVFQGEQRSWQVEQYMLQNFIQIIRICGGEDWVPAEVMINSRNSPQPVPEEWQGIRFTWGQKFTALKFPGTILELPPRPENSIESTTDGGRPGDLSRVSMKGLVGRQLESGKATLDNAANELGISSATLKRRLHRIGTSYSELLESCRIEKAKTRLLGTRVSVNQLSHDLGYRFPQNFTRSFKRVTGMTPTEFRNC